MAEREILEKDALEVVCACWYYELADNMDTMSDEELMEIITNPPACRCEEKQ